MLKKCCILPTLLCISHKTQSLKSMASPSAPSSSPKHQTNSYDIHSASMEGVYIGISGLIGAGKSTLATALAKRLNLPVYYEPVKDNEYLQDFYGDIKKYSFPMQVYLLNKRFQQQQSIIWQGRGGVQDRTIYEDSIFAKMLSKSGLMDERDYRTYLELFKNMSNFMRKPNLICHLDVSPEESLRRIQMRNRGCESGITLEYLQNLHAAYQDFLKEISKLIPVIRVNYEKFRTADEMAKAIAERWEAMTNIHYVDFENNQTGASEKNESVSSEETLLKKLDFSASHRGEELVHDEVEKMVSA